MLQNVCCCITQMKPCFQRLCPSGWPTVGIGWLSWLSVSSAPKQWQHSLRTLFSWQIRMISSGKGTVLCTILSSIDCLSKNLPIRSTKINQTLKDVSEVPRLTRSKFMRVPNCYFHFLPTSVVGRGSWGSNLLQDKGTSSWGLMPMPLYTPLSFSPSSLNEVAFSGWKLGFWSHDMAWDTGRKPLSSAPIILFYKILGCDYSLFQPESSSWKAVCPKEGKHLLFQSGGDM